jgi:hypothetical protein
MSLVTSLASRAARVALIGPAVTRLKRKLVRSVVSGILLAVLGGIGALFLLAALRTELERHLGPTWSPLIIGVTFCLFAGITYLVFLRPRAADAREARAAERKANNDFVRPVRRFEEKLSARPWLSVAGSLGTGFLAAFLVYLLQAKKRRNSRMARHSGNGLDTIPWSRQVVIQESEPRN